MCINLTVKKNNHSHRNTFIKQKEPLSFKKKMLKSCMLHFCFAEKNGMKLCHSITFQSPFSHISVDGMAEIYPIKINWIFLQMSDNLFKVICVWR